MPNTDHPGELRSERSEGLPNRYAYANSITHSHPYDHSNGYPNSHPEPHTHAVRHSDSESDPNSYANAHGNRYAYGNPGSRYPRQDSGHRS
jgi:hypothetical protein